jgi:hypothetical protein
MDIQSNLGVGGMGTGGATLRSHGGGIHYSDRDRSFNRRKSSKRRDSGKKLREVDLPLHTLSEDFPIARLK